MICVCSNHLNHIQGQGRIQDLAQGGTNQARSARNFFVPPLSDFCPPPESLRGGDILAVPPWIAQAGDNSQGGDSPPPEIAQGGDSLLFPSPPVSALVCIYKYFQQKYRHWNRGKWILCMQYVLCIYKYYLYLTYIHILKYGKICFM